MYLIVYCRMYLIVYRKRNCPTKQERTPFARANPTIHCICHNSNCCGFPKRHFHILHSLRFSNRFSIISPTISPAVSPSVSPILYCFHASSLGTSFAHPFLHRFLCPFLQEILRFFFTVSRLHFLLILKPPWSGKLPSRNFSVWVSGAGAPSPEPGLILYSRK